MTLMNQSMGDLMGMPWIFTDIIGTSELTINQAWTLGNTPWIFQSNDPLDGLPVPEPASLILFGAGLLGLYATRKRIMK